GGFDAALNGGNIFAGAAKGAALGAGIGAATGGAFHAVGRAGNAARSAAQSYASGKIKAPTTVRTGRYGDLASELRGTGQQANHLNQNAAFKSIIPEEEGLSHALRGNAFTEPGTPHFEFHRSLE